MGRCAVFVDAGYLFARGSDAIAGHTLPRHRLLLDEKQAVEALVGFAASRTADARLLRVYWYDAASSQGPNADHIRLAETDDVKLRLGTINTFGQQKGVDSLIIADLIELARNGAIDSAVLVSGDDDLRVGVQVAQTLGIRVHLLGITGSDGEAQSKLLVREADTCRRWSAQDVARFLSVREPAPITPQIGPGGENHEMRAALPVPETSAAPEDGIDVNALLSETAAAFATTLQPIDLTDIRTVYEATRKIPYQNDRRLLATARTRLGRDLVVSESRLLRQLFVAALQGDGQG